MHIVILQITRMSTRTPIAIRTGMPGIVTRQQTSAAPLR